MIQMPRRSVTRFFIPLIDVLTLLFCIFLLMPLVQSSTESAVEEDRLAREEQLLRLEHELQRLRQQGNDLPQEMRDELERLRKEKIKALQDRLAIRVLDIDGQTGKLYSQDGDERVEIGSQAVAEALVERDLAGRKEGKEGKGEIYYLILYPRDRNSPFPHRDQRAQYDNWFKDVAHGYDIPGVAPQQGNRP
jgi:hypothetical protein